MKGNFHVRCQWGEKPEISSKVYLSILPEVNDRVRLYFPNETEDDAYVISSIHLPPSPSPAVKTTAARSNGMSAMGSANQSLSNSSPKEPPRSNPDNKSIMNKFQKQVELTPSGIFITNNNGMSIVIDDESGIQIISDKDIIIQSEETLSIISKNEAMSLEASERIELKQGEATIKLEDDITVEGAKVLIQ